MSVTVRSREIARAAFGAVEARAKEFARSPGKRDKYRGFALAFPTLIHTSGLAQATAFAFAKGDEKLDVLDDLATTIQKAIHRSEAAANHPGRELQRIARETEDVMEYLRLSRVALQCATWIKRYSEALLKTGDADDSTK